MTRQTTRASTTAIMVGAGQRGHDVYGRWALDHPDRLTFVAVVDQSLERQARFGDAHSIPLARRFADVDALVAAGIEASGAIVATPDLAHARDAASLVAAGYYVLTEKPMASSLGELGWLLNVVGDDIERLQVAFGLRLAPYWVAIHEIVTSGRLGEVVTVTHTENLAPWFMAHSYVRGNWGLRSRATPMIVAKCSHDFDQLAWNTGSRVVRLASFGSLAHFRPDKAPDGARRRCTDGRPVHGCLFDARTIYLDPDAEAWLMPVVMAESPTEGIIGALRTGPYGRCVYHARSDVIDHQTVAMELADGTTMTLQLNGHSYQRDASARATRYDGSRATLRAIHMSESAPSIEIHDHGGGGEVVELPSISGSHGGADDLIMRSFADHARSGMPMATNAREALEGHLLAFAAEEARLSGNVVDVDALRHRQPAHAA